MLRPNQFDIPVARQRRADAVRARRGFIQQGPGAWNRLRSADACLIPEYVQDAAGALSEHGRMPVIAGCFRERPHERARGLDQMIFGFE